MARQILSSVCEGRQLHAAPLPSQPANPRVRLAGVDGAEQPAIVYLDDDLFSKHTLFLGGIGTGKSNALYHLVRQIKSSMTAADVMIIFDTKGDFLHEFGAPGDVIISNDSQARGSSGSPDYWNIYSEIEPGERLEENITEIAKTLFFDKIHDSKQPFFPNAAKDIFGGILTFFCRAGEGMDNQALRTFFDTYGTDMVRQVLQKQEDMAGIASYIEGDDSRQSQGIISELQQLVREIFIGNFKKKGSLSMRQLVRAKGGRTVFIEYDIGIGSMLTPIYRLLFDMAIKEALSRNKSEGNVWLIADEFRLIPHLHHIENAVNFGRSLGIKLLVGIQNIDQLYDVYGVYAAKSVLSGFSSTFAFRLNDWSSREYVRSQFGVNRKREKIPSVSDGKTAVAVRDAYVVEDWDIASLKTGQAIVGFPGQEPFLFRFGLYTP